MKAAKTRSLQGQTNCEVVPFIFINTNRLGHTFTITKISTLKHVLLRVYYNVETLVVVKCCFKKIQVFALQKNAITKKWFPDFQM